jgi:hypothetical protein
VVSPLIPDTYLVYSPGITMDRGQPIRGGTASYYRRRIWDLCASGNLVSSANKGGCARGNIITDEYISYASAIVMLAIRKSLLVPVRPFLAAGQLGLERPPLAREALASERLLGSTRRGGAMLLA